MTLLQSGPPLQPSAVLLDPVDSTGSMTFAPGPEGDVAAVLELMRDATTSTYGVGHELVAHLVEVPGKMVRPHVVMLTARSLGEPGETFIDRARMAAAAVELLHLGSLYHDDVIDRSDSRRGRPTANAVHGNIAAVLGGDVLFAASSCLAADLGRHQYRLLAFALDYMCRGQVIESMNTGNLAMLESAYWEAVAGKTAWLLGAAAALGCYEAGVSRDRMERISRAATDIGLAFQVLDDLVRDTLGSSALVVQLMGRHRTSDGAHRVRIGTVGAAHDLGADAVAVQMDCRAGGAVLEGVCALLAEARAAGLPSLLMLGGAAAIEDLAATLRSVAELPADYVKVDPEGVLSKLPVLGQLSAQLLLAGGPYDSERFATDVKSAFAVGFAGVCVGRNLVQATDPSLLVARVDDAFAGAQRPGPGTVTP